MSTTENQGYFRLLTRLISRLFSRREGKKLGQRSFNGTFKSLQHGNLNQSHTSYHGDEEAFWFI